MAACFAVGLPAAIIDYLSALPRRSCSPKKARTSTSRAAAGRAQCLHHCIGRLARQPSLQRLEGRRTRFRPLVDGRPQGPGHSRCDQPPAPRRPGSSRQAAVRRAGRGHQATPGRLDPAGSHGAPGNSRASRCSSPRRTAASWPAPKWWWTVASRRSEGFADEPGNGWPHITNRRHVRTWASCS